MQTMIIDIPTPQTPSEQPTALTSMEIADLKPSQRLIYTYERTIEDMKYQIRLLNQQNNDLTATVNTKSAQVEELIPLKRANLDMYVQFLFSTFFMGFGGALTGSFPMVNNTAPWQFSVGWTLLGIGLISSMIQQPIVMIAYKKIVNR